MKKLTAPEAAAVCWDGLRALKHVRGESDPVPWSQLPDWDRDEIVSIVELYAQGATAEETYTAQRDAALDAGADLDDEVVPWAELPAAARESGELMFALVQAIAPEPTPEIPF